MIHGAPNIANFIKSRKTNDGPSTLLGRRVRIVLGHVNVDAHARSIGFRGNRPIAVASNTFGNLSKFIRRISDRGNGLGIVVRVFNHRAVTRLSCGRISGNWGGCYVCLNMLVWCVNAFEHVS